VRIVTEQLKPGLPTSAADVSRMSPSDIVNYLKTHYLRPDWSYWQNMGVVLLQRAVWLSFDIQPSGSDDVVGNRLPAEFEGYRIALRDALADDYRRRMQQCLSNIQAGKLPARRVNQGYLVRLDRFRQFAETLPTPFALSDEFPRIAPAAGCAGKVVTARRASARGRREAARHPRAHDSPADNSRANRDSARPPAREPTAREQSDLNH
jgi:hypothetical protein